MTINAKCLKIKFTAVSSYLRSIIHTTFSRDEKNMVNSKKMDMSNDLLAASSSSTQIDDITIDYMISSGRACGICHEPFKFFHPPYITNCMHEYHVDCYFKWGNFSRDCLVCLQPLESWRFNTRIMIPKKIFYGMEKMEVSEDIIPGVLFCGANRNDQFQIRYPIGESNNGLVRVYHAFWGSTNVDIKCVDMDCQPRALLNLKSDVKRNRTIPDHPNIIGIIKDFNYMNCYCVAFPHQYDSLRWIMSALWYMGLPEECTVVALKETLKAVYHIHRNGDVHLEIKARNIFLNRNKIQIAYSTSVYERQDQNQFSKPNYSGKDLADYKTDVWMFGITAIELACGGLGVIMSAKDLRKRLAANKSEYDKRKVMSKLIKWRKMSKAFQEMVVSCLSKTPPTVGDLLEYDVFTRSNKDVNYFSRVVGFIC